MVSIFVHGTSLTRWILRVAIERTIVESSTAGYLIFEMNGQAQTMNKKWKDISHITSCYSPLVFYSSCSSVPSILISCGERSINPNIRTPDCKTQVPELEVLFSRPFQISHPSYAGTLHFNASILIGHAENPEVSIHHGCCSLARSESEMWWLAFTRQWAFSDRFQWILSAQSSLITKAALYRD